jgi:hypothetical protein
MFDGEVDERMRERYIGRRVLNLETQSPTRWLGPSISKGDGPKIEGLKQ